MSTEQIEALFERIESDEEFRAALEAADSPEAKQKLVADAGFEIDRSDLGYVKEKAGLEGDISDEELQTIAGGVTPNPNQQGGGGGGDPTPPDVPAAAAAASAAAAV